MFRHLLLTTALALACVPMTVCAANVELDIEQRLTPEQRHATGLDTLSPEQLALLNRLLREDAAKRQAPVSASVDANIATPERTAPAEEGMRAPRGDASDRPIKARVVGTLSAWQPGFVFKLDNGQHWQVLKGSATLRKPLEGPEIQLVAGLAGRWFLQVDEDMPKARVYRID